nr:unnamed protein product [Callosobruchus chinensis]
MHPRNFSPQGGRSSYIKNRTIPIAPLSPGVSRPGMDCLLMYLLSRQVLAYLSLASTNFP